MSEADPFTKTYEALWQLLEDDTDFTALVKPGNRIKYSTVDGVAPRPKPDKEAVQDDDLPEVRLVSETLSPHLLRSSNGSSIRRIYAIQVSTGDLRYTKLYPLEFAILRALSRWQDVLPALTWNGKTFVNLVSSQEAREGKSQSDLNRGIQGWATVWSIVVDMWFTTSDLQAT